MPRLSALLLAGACLLAVPLAVAQPNSLSAGTLRAIGGQGYALEMPTRVAAGPGDRTIVSGRTSLDQSTWRHEVFLEAGGEWERLDGTFDGDILALAVSSGGVPHAAGSFRSVDGRSVSTVARWNGMEWRQLGTGLEAGAIHTLSFSADGTLYAVFRTPQSPGPGTQRILRWTGTEWQTVGAEHDLTYECSAFGPCDGLGIGPDGSLYAAVPGVSRWDGTSWTPVSAVPLLGAKAIVVTDDGTVHAFGRFQEWNGRSLNGAARLAGDSWERMGLGLEGGVKAAVLAADGSIWAAGQLGWDRALARWNGTSWQQREDGAAVNSGTLQSVAARATGGVVAVGRLLGSSTGVGNVTREYTESTATDLARAFDAPVRDLAIAADGSVLAAGAFTSTSNGTVDYAARWRAGIWGAMPAVPIQSLDVIVAGDGETMYTAGFYSRASTQTAHAIYEVTAGGPSEIGGTVIVSPGAATAYSDLLIAQDGALLVTGRFDHLATASGRGVARWDGAWSLLGGPMETTTQGVAQAPDGTVYALAGHELRRYTGSGWEPLGQAAGTTADVHVGANGAVYVAGTFSSIGGVAATDVARWQDGTWTALADGPGWPVQEVRTDAQGAPTACGGGIARWNGAVWIQEVEIATDRTIFACDFSADGDLVFGGDFAEPNGVNAPYIAMLESPGFVASEPTPSDDGLSLTLAPNPTSGSAGAFVSGLTANGVVTLYDALGRRIARVEVGPALSRTPVVLPTADLSPGVYVVRLTSGESVETRRLVITR